MTSKFSLLFVILLSSIIYAQDIRVEVVDPPVEYTGNIPGDWGTDLVALNNEPMGPMGGVVRGDSIFIAVPDTLGAPTGALRILKSSNNGANWLLYLNVTGTGVIAKTRMVKSGLDSIYCTIRTLSGNAIYNIRVNLPLADPVRPIFTGGYRDFDCWASSTGGYYIFLDSLLSNSIPRVASTNGGITWNQRAVVSSNGANPYCQKSLTGDTTTLMYYRDPFAADTTTQGITFVRYRESAPGTLSALTFIQPLIPAGLQRDQFAGVLAGAVGWVIYTEGAPGARNLMLMTTTNNGANWTAPVALTAGTADKYWFDAKPYLTAGGLDMIYYWDSTGGPSNTTDKILYRSATVGAPGNFTAPVQISEFYPQFSSRGYMPQLVQYYNAAGDVAALWVGVDGANRKLYFDRLGAVVGVHQNNNQVPEVYSLSQNYPNPFNPVTKINFSIPKNALVTLKIYDVLGREVAELINKDMTAGHYTVDYDASALPSGVYFYKISSGDFTDTKKMMLVK